METTIELLLGVLGIVAITWGFERYRSEFSKTELLISFIVGGGLLTLSVVPTVVDTIGGLLNLEKRFVTASLLANLFLFGLVLYLIKLLRGTRRDVAKLTRNLTIEQANEDSAVPDGGKSPISIIIPAYNESGSIQEVVRELPETIHGYPVEAIVVSDGSEDDTAKRANVDEVTVVEHPLNQGQGGALQTGFEIALQRGAEVVVTMDGDGQHSAEELSRLVEPVVNDEADFVMGSRYLGQDHSGNSAVRQAGIHTFTWLINGLTKSDISDCTNGYRAIRGSLVGDLRLTEERFSAPELIIEAKKNSARLREIPVIIKEREVGETKKPQLGYAIGITRTILTAWIR